MSVSDEYLGELKTLHARSADARNGYDEGLTLTQDAAVVTVFRDLIELHEAHLKSLDHALRRHDQQPDSEGSWMTPVHKTIMNVRSWFGGLDTSVLDGVVDGEMAILDQVERVRNLCPDGHADHEMLDRLRVALSHKLDQLKRMQSASTEVG